MIDGRRRTLNVGRRSCLYDVGSGGDRVVRWRDGVDSGGNRVVCCRDSVVRGGDGVVCCRVRMLLLHHSNCAGM